MKKLLTVLLVLVTVSGFALKLNESNDPLAARKDASGIDAGVWRAAIDVFSKAETTAAIATETTNRQAADADLQPIASMSDYLLANTAATEYIGTDTVIAYVASETADRISSDSGKMDTDGSNGASTVAFPGSVTTVGHASAIGTITAQAGYDLTVASGAYLGGGLLVATGSTISIGSRNMLISSGTSVFLGGAGNTLKAFDTTVGIGVGAFGSLGSTGTPDESVAIGYNALNEATTTYNNVAIGSRALEKLTTSAYKGNCAAGTYALRNVLGSSNTAFGGGALTSLTTGNGSCAFGSGAGGNLTTGQNNFLFGTNSGRWLADGISPNLTSSGCMLLGLDTKTLATGTTNEIVIGNFSTGNGTNSVTLGNTDVTLTVLSPGTCIATNTAQSGYQLTVATGSTGSIWAEGGIRCNSIVDGSDSPETLADAYAIVESHESIGKKVDHSKLSPLAWGTKTVQRATGRTLTRTVTTTENIKADFPEPDGTYREEPTEITRTEEYPEVTMEVVPDQSGRNLSVVISAQAMVIKDLTRRLEALEKNK
jgi:hypothetical protein